MNRGCGKAITTHRPTSFKYVVNVKFRKPTPRMALVWTDELSYSTQIWFNMISSFMLVVISGPCPLSIKHRVCSQILKDVGAVAALFFGWKVPSM